MRGLVGAALNGATPSLKARRAMAALAAMLLHVITAGAPSAGSPMQRSKPQVLIPAESAPKLVAMPVRSSPL